MPKSAYEYENKGSFAGTFCRRAKECLRVSRDDTYFWDLAGKERKSVKTFDQPGPLPMCEARHKKSGPRPPLLMEFAKKSNTKIGISLSRKKLDGG